jgi:hypothetical protein
METMDQRFRTTRPGEERKFIMSSEPGYTLIDCATDLIYGPYETFDQARRHADDFATWEILNGGGTLVDWSLAHETAAKAKAA